MRRIMLVASLAVAALMVPAVAHASCLPGQAGPITSVGTPSIDYVQAGGTGEDSTLTHLGAAAQANCGKVFTSSVLSLSVTVQMQHQNSDGTWTNQGNTFTQTRGCNTVTSRYNCQAGGTVGAWCIPGAWRTYINESWGLMGTVPSTQTVYSPVATFTCLEYRGAP